MPITYGPPKSYDVNSENWACRDHARRIRVVPFDPDRPEVNGLQNLKTTKYSDVNPEKSMHAGGTLVKGKSKKGKFLRERFVATCSKSDDRIDARPAPKYRQPEPILFAPKHEGTPVKTAKKIRLGSTVGR